MMTVSGGATSLIGDLGEAAGLNFPPIAEATNVRIQEILGVERAFGNPLDTVGLPRLRRDGNISAVVQALQDDDGVDVIGLVLGMRGDGWGSHQELVDRLAAAAKGARKPLMVVSFMSNSLTRHWRGYAQANGLPLVEDLERGLKAVRHLIDYATFRRSPVRRTVVSAQAVTLPRVRVLTEVQSKAILGAAGLPVTREALARDPAEAVRLAAEIGGAVALKIQSADIAHKSDIGGVHLGARTAAEVEAAARKVFDNARRNCPGATIDGILVQEMVEDGVELILGMTYDETFWPMVVCGAGGVTVEVFKDAAVLLPPFTADEARAAIGSLKVAQLLDGFRGAPPRDVDALIDCCVRFGDFVAATDGQYAAIDLNPVLVCARGRGVRIADALMEARARRRRMSKNLVTIAMAFVVLRSGLRQSRPFAQAPDDILKYNGPDREQKLIEGARKEGQVVFYSAMIVNQALRPITDKFGKKYPFIKMTLLARRFRGHRAKSVGRGARRQRRRRCDRGHRRRRAGGAGRAAGALYDARDCGLPGALSRSGQHVDADAALLLQHRLQHAAGAARTKCRRRYEDLLDPQWKGKIAWRIGSASGTPLFITNLRLAWGEDKARAYFEKLKEQKIVNFGAGSRAHAGRSRDRGRICDRAEYLRAPPADQQSQGRAGELEAARPGRVDRRHHGRGEGRQAPARGVAAHRLYSVAGRAGNPAGRRLFPG